WHSDPMRLVVIDNGSTDESPARIDAWVSQQASTRVRFLRNADNLGVAAGNNAGIRWALARDPQPDFIWLLNNDTRPTRDALTHLLEAARERPEIRVWGSTLLEADGETVQYAGGGYYNPVLSLQTNLYAGLKKQLVVDEEVRVGLDFVCAASMLVRAEMFSNALLNEQFFLYYEELDLCRRVTTKGEIAWCPKSMVIHAEGASTAGSRTGLELRTFHENLSTFKFTAIHYRWCLPAVLAVRLLIKPILFIGRKQWFLLRPLFRAYAQFFRWLANHGGAG
ncbi:MAG: glycosyltransferase, partial [Burkholderiales bacterium]|nr:glycosyltransferase [Burkholderiales bacterium]